MRVGTAIGVLIGLLIGAGTAFATTNFMNGSRFTTKSESYQTGYVAGVADMLWLVRDTGMEYVRDAVDCLNSHSEWGTDDLLHLVQSGLAGTPGDSKYTMASNVANYIAKACK